MMAPTESERVASTPPARSGSAHLTAQIAKGDEQAFASFYELWFDRALAMARKATRRDESFCLDVVQDCMMRVVRAMRSLETEEAVQAWMARAILTTAVDRLRADRRRKRREQVSARSELDPHDVSHDAEIAERNRWLAEHIKRLPGRDQELLAARFGDDKTLQQVGEALGMTGHAAHGRIRRLLEKLRDAARDIFS